MVKEENNRRDRLPVWAQREMEILEMRAKEWEAKAREFGREIDVPSSNTFLDLGSYPADHQPLGKDARVVFFAHGRKDSDLDAWSHRFDVRLDGDDLYVSGGDGIVVQPWSANVVKVRLSR